MKEYAYWLDTLQDQAASLPGPPKGAAVSLADTVDVAIIGAGYTGLAAARHLARQGASVIVLEREHVGWGASSRNGGQVLTGLKLDPTTLLARYGDLPARRLFEAAAESMVRLETLISEESIRCDYERAGHIQAAAKPKHFEAFREEQTLLARTFRHRVELVSRAEQRSELGSDAYHGLLVDEHSGALNPARYVHGLAAAAGCAGARIAAGVAVKRIERRSNGSRLIFVARAAPEVGNLNELHARDVLVATNGYTDEAAPALRRRLVPIGSYIIATEPLRADQAATILPRRRVAFDSKYFLHYFRLSADRRLLFGGRAEFSRPDAESSRRAATILRREMTRIFPDLASVRLDYAWGGNVAFTRDQMPHAGRLDGLYYAGGYCGHGIAMATYLGELVARRLAGQPIDNPLFDVPIPTIPLYRGTPWFLPLVGAYYKWLDLVS